MISFNGAYFHKEILYAFFYMSVTAYPIVICRKLGKNVALILTMPPFNRWVINYSPLITASAQKRKRANASSWRVDETYVKVKGKWVYWYRAVDKFGDTLDFNAV